MSKTVQDFIDAARGELDAYEARIVQFGQEMAANDQQSEELAARLASEHLALGRSIVADPETALAWTNSDENLRKEFEQHQQAVDTATDRIVEIEATPTYFQRDTLKTELEELLNDSATPFEQMREDHQRLGRYERMQTLVSNGFGTTRYRHGGWRKYLTKEGLQDWKFSDRIAEAERVPNAGVIVDRYRTLGEKLELHAQDTQRNRKKLDELLALIAEHGAKVAFVANAPDVWAGLLGDRLSTALLDHPEETMRTDVSSRADKDALTRVSGLRHQIIYLKQIREQLESDRSTLVERSRKLDDEQRRYSSNRHRYRNKRFTDEAFAKRFGRSAAYDNRLNLYRDAGSTVYSFSDYGRGSTMNDILWWDVMTDGRMNGNFLPGVASYRDQNPTYAYERTGGSMSFRSSGDENNDRLDPLDTDAS
jgi:hypothetical protein